MKMAEMIVLVRMMDDWTKSAELNMMVRMMDDSSAVE